MLVGGDYSSDFQIHDRILSCSDQANADRMKCLAGQVIMVSLPGSPLNGLVNRLLLPCPGSTARRVLELVITG